MKRYWGLLIVLGLTVWTAGCSESGGKAYDANISQEEKDAFIKKLNAVRSDGCGKHEGIVDSNLTWNDALFRAAAEHAEDIRESGTLNTDGKGSGTASDHTAQVRHLGHASTLDDRLRNNGYHKTVAREVATRTNEAPDLNAIFSLWTSDEESCGKIMDPNLTEFGLAHIRETNASAEYTDFWVIDLGKPAAEDTWF